MKQFTFGLYILGWTLVGASCQPSNSDNSGGGSGGGSNGTVADPMCSSKSSLDCSSATANCEFVNGTTCTGSTAFCAGIATQVACQAVSNSCSWSTSCVPAVVGTILPTPTPLPTTGLCSSYPSTSCASVSGCVLINGLCSSAPLAATCAAYPETSCAVSGCQWYGSYCGAVSTVTPTVSTCSAYPQASCLASYGCQWSGSSCQALTTTGICSQLKLAACLLQTGCGWSFIGKVCVGK